MPIRPTWRRWFSDFQQSVEALALQDVDLLDDDKAELKSTALALFGRLQSELDSALVLIDARRELAFRNACRSVIDCALHLYAAETDAQYLTRLKEDDEQSRRSRAKRHLAVNEGRLPKEQASILNGFIKRMHGPKQRLLVSEIDSPVPRLSHVYREISADALHVSWTSLHRHVFKNKDGDVQLALEPKVSRDELEEAASALALSVLFAMRSLLIILPEIAVTYNLHGMFAKYKKIDKRGLKIVA
ncbi:MULTISPECIES: hypothetical protein [unclassified Mesorhizobium]|uniref:hypothetical protein n=1 Tax=unclassified Mesorhizobium TaxID=325217 RepID=UPI00192639F6|nr:MULTISPECIES: hypothetical protein [unclassified Mesorhizobium]BCG97198.1 hypothetical protein MesoLj131a_60620 [Mesorhizobium sp. 131-2-1]BCH04270.1 hypothetical protein MesoLj131b_62690 [Mesorhizobium sp. 131-2-5]